MTIVRKLHSQMENTSSAGHSVPTLQLRPHQVEHFIRLLFILAYIYFYIDGSEMGTGKTYVTAAVSIYLKLPVIVVCPSSARSVWLDVLRTYGVSVYNLPLTGGVITYETLRSVKGHQPRHGLLNRIDGESVTFTPTSTWTDIIKAGVLLVFDECQKVKNQSDQNKAAKALIQQVYALGGKSRIALLSGSVLDKDVQVINLLRMIGFINARNLYSKVRGEVRLEGIADLAEWGRRMDLPKTINFMARKGDPINNKEAVEYVFDMFVEVIKPKVMSIMPRPARNGILDIKNGFYLVDDETEYLTAISQLSKAVRYNPETKFILMQDMGAVTNALVRLEKAKMGAAVRKAKEDLQRVMYNEKGEPIYYKIMLYANYYQVIDYYKAQLGEYSPLELTGRIKENDRTRNIELFCQPNLQHRVMIANPVVGGIAVSLDDRDGHFPRKTYAMPSYRINENHQMTRRGDRNDTIGDVVVRFVYGLTSCNLKENNILEAMQKKGDKMKKFHIEQSEYGAKFPSEYESEYEVDPSTLRSAPTLADITSGIQDLTLSF